MSDIVERLQSQNELFHIANIGQWTIDESKIEPLCVDAINEIVRLREELMHTYEKCAKIAESQRKRLDYELSYTGKDDDLKPVYPAEGHLIAAAIRAAAAALKETGDE